MNIESFDWQTVSAVLIVIGSVAYLTRKWLKTGDGLTACGSCTSCSTNSAAKATPLFELK